MVTYTPRYFLTPPGRFPQAFPEVKNRINCFGNVNQNHVSSQECPDWCMQPVVEERKNSHLVVRCIVIKSRGVAEAFVRGFIPKAKAKNLMYLYSLTQENYPCLSKKTKD